MRAMLLVVSSLLLAGCPKDSAPTPPTTPSAKPKSVDEKSKDDDPVDKEPSKKPEATPSASASAEPVTEGAELTPEAYCNAIASLAPPTAKPKPSDLQSCVADAVKRKTDHPDRYACQARCVSKATALDTARNCSSMCNDPKTVCAQVSAPTKAACLTRLEKVFTGKVDAKAYACFAACIAKSPQDATGLTKSIECLGTDCGL